MPNNGFYVGQVFINNGNAGAQAAPAVAPEDFGAPVLAQAKSVVKMEITWKSDRYIPESSKDRVLDRDRGSYVVCSRCKSMFSSPYFFDPNTGTGLCRTCRCCRNCGVPAQKMNRDGICTECVCVGCGKIGTLSAPYRDLRIGPQCYNCFVKTHPESRCRQCNARLGEVWVHGDKDYPTLCSRCPGADPNILCFFCDGTATFIEKVITNGAVKIFGVCGDCKETPSCFKNCSPVAQCDSCKERESIDKNPHGHIKNGKCNCQLCRVVRDRGVFHFENPDLTFYEAPSVIHRRRNDSPRCLSVEIEVAGVRDHGKLLLISDVARKWKMSGIVLDASLDKGGFEINTAPAAGDFFVEQIDDICSALRKATAYVDKKCGTHIHIDMRDHSWYDLKKFMLLYARVEPALIRTQPFGRVMAERSHCYPCGESLVKDLLSGTLPPEQMKKQIVSNVYGGKIKNRPPRKRRGNNREIAARYNAMNLHSYFHRQTVECRLHTGTLRADKIKKWATALASLVDSAYALSERDIRSMKGDSLEILTSLVPHDSAEYILNRIKEFGGPYGPMPTVLLPEGVM